MEFTIAYGDFDKDPVNYYIADDNPIGKAIDLALMLGKPLLLTGEPGTGKTQLAYYAAWYLAQKMGESLVPFLNTPFKFDTKTSSAGKDMFYEYDAVSHFHSRIDDGSRGNLSAVEHQTSHRKTIADFLQLAPMGKAIVQTWGRNEAVREYGIQGVKNISEIAAEPRSSVVLIDEIDKAPRDFPNDLLNEIENYEFYINELSRTIKRKTSDNPYSDARILIIMTSNVEKNLPDAFLRRCIFYHIPFPGDMELLNIVQSRIRPFLNQNPRYKTTNLDQKYKDAIVLFNKARASAANKKPATSELLDWIKALHLYDLLKSDMPLEKLDDTQQDLLRFTLHTLFKSQKDFEIFDRTHFK